MGGLAFSLSVSEETGGILRETFRHMEKTGKPCRAITGMIV
ncbi:hypothetical protein HMPREF9141_2356 [Prevotella multiformis DSM 16608]|uniref:Uncharacterized protein n=1 Tax=Prevotella multiformis DSM 16608 TaxID=888743 RepID=F0F9T9_9BACT|nr:hypothetical protein HMPREF9141_2356 [Prevotella multiformis DSM 16608]